MSRSKAYRAARRDRILASNRGQHFKHANEHRRSRKADRADEIAARRGRWNPKSKLEKSP